MPTALYTTDVQKITDRTPKTTLTDTDVFVVANSSGTLAPITKVNAKTTLGIDDAETALNAVKGTGWIDENLVDHEDRITQNESDIGYLEINVADLEGEGRTIETVKGNADAIALRELLSNKKTTLADNSDTFYPTQKAVKTVTDDHETRLSGLDTLVYEGKTYMVSKRIENGHLVTTYTEVI